MRSQSLGRWAQSIKQLKRVCSLQTRFIPQVEQAAGQGTPQRATLIAKPTISASEAVVRAAENLGESINEKEIIVLEEDPQAADKRQEFSSRPQR